MIILARSTIFLLKNREYSIVRSIIISICSRAWWMVIISELGEGCVRSRNWVIINISWSSSCRTRRVSYSYILTTTFHNSSSVTTLILLLLVSQYWAIIFYFFNVYILLHRRCLMLQRSMLIIHSVKVTTLIQNWTLIRGWHLRSCWLVFCSNLLICI